MRTKNLFRLLTAATLAVCFSMSAFGQLTTNAAAALVETPTAVIGDFTSGAQQEFVDMVSVGSKVPYSITQDPNITALVAADAATFANSIFSWRVSGGETFEQLNSNAGLTPVGSYTPTGYSETDVAIAWGTSGTYTITVAEIPQNNLGLPVDCSGADEVLTVYVMPLPTITFNEANCEDASSASIEGTAGDEIIGGCGIAGTTISLAVDFTGTESFNLGYSYTFTPFGGATSAATDVDETALGSANFYTATPGTPNTDADLLAFAVPSGAGTYGRYEFTLTYVNDLVSRKSLNTVADPARGTLGAVTTLTLISLPTPTTQKIQHVTNAGW